MRIHLIYFARSHASGDGHPVTATVGHIDCQRLRHQLEHLVGVVQLVSTRHPQPRHGFAATQQPIAIAAQLGQEVLQTHVVGADHPVTPGPRVQAVVGGRADTATVEHYLFARLDHLACRAVMAVGKHRHRTLLHGQQGALGFFAHQQACAQGA
ncbi:conserved hypothetical protein [Ricinus communis]|uniref:Uncharacterized protein n=1 Tax=Ricinus communis TaxID=3988 RepID=B9TK00_RICCO|nr:conserved hypothetical protein [Ricinus communis]